MLNIKLGVEYRGVSGRKRRGTLRQEMDEILFQRWNWRTVWEYEEEGSNEYTTAQIWPKSGCILQCRRYAEVGGDSFRHVSDANPNVSRVFLIRPRIIALSFPALFEGLHLKSGSLAFVPLGLKIP